MPTYEYACTECGDRLEVVQSFSDAPLTTCPACQGKLRKLFSPVGVVFKGSGFYKTDSRNGKPKTSAGATSGSGKDKDSDGSSKSTTSDTTATGGSESSGKPEGAKEPAASTSSAPTGGGKGSTGGGSKVA